MSYTYDYPRPALTVDAIVIAKAEDKNMLLLIQRKSDPCKDKWALPGGFTGIEETLEEACKRELMEETGVENIEFKQFYTFDAIDRDPRGRTISMVFYGFVSELFPLTGGDDARDARWFPLNALPELAFDHKEVVEKFVREKL